MGIAHIRLSILLVAGACCASTAFAQGYPNKPIRIHTTGAGGGTDTAARLIASELSPLLGQQIVVENQSNPTLLATGVQKAVPDGYTLLAWGPAFWTGPLFEKAPWDVARDFAPVVTLTRSPNILIASNTLPAKSVGELVSLAKGRPGELNYSTGANGSSAHIGMELFKMLTGTSLQRIMYKGGTAQELSDLMSGQLHLTLGSGAAWGAQIKAGKLRALASAGGKRSTLFPDLPTVEETVPGFVSESLLAVFAPARTPEPVVRRLNQEMGKALEKPDVRERMLKSGQEPAGGTPEQLADAVKAEVARVQRILQAGGGKSEN